jgi:predicted nucleic acid-binding protein
VSIVYDAGPLIAAERGDRRTWTDHRARLELGSVPRTTAPVVAQVSRSPRQVQLRRFLRGCDVLPFATDQSHEVGRLLALSGRDDVVGAHLVLTAASIGATVLTTDPDDLHDLELLASSRGGHRARSGRKRGHA